MQTVEARNDSLTFPGTPDLAGNPAPLLRAVPTPPPAPGAPAASSGLAMMLTQSVDGFDQAVARLRAEDAFVVPAQATIRGDVEGKALLLEGNIVGNVRVTGPIIIMHTAKVTGTVECTGDLIIAGTVENDDEQRPCITSSQGKLVLTMSARVRGEVRYKTIALYDGAILDGVIKPLAA